MVYSSDDGIWVLMLLFIYSNSDPNNALVSNQLIPLLYIRVTHHTHAISPSVRQILNQTLPLMDFKPSLLINHVLISTS
jgi:hypothetical protein